MTDTSNCTQAHRDQAIAWLLRLRDAPADTLLEQAFAEWLAANPAHPLAYQQAEAQWAWMDAFKGQGFRARDEALRYRPPVHKPLWRGLAGYGMAATVLLGVGWAMFSPQGWYGLPRSYGTDKGQRQSLALSDGSHLELNTDTEVRVHFNHHQRHVDLVRGEAFFEVGHDVERPFTVHVGNVLIRDIGTAFDVYKQSGQISVAVREGVVEMEGQGERREVSAGQQLAYDNGGRFVEVSQADIASATAWRQGLLLFRGRRLAEVLAEIGRYHDVDIRLPDPKLADLRVNGSFRTEQLDNMLNAVATLLPVNVKRIGEKEIVLEAAR
ncbi:MAG: FecR family protein [Methylococcaceae bacterium]|nr:FecR family protein [Methylococcaceae bacterium]